MLIEELNFTVRVRNCLRRARVDTVEQLAGLSDDDLLRLRNFGPKCLTEVRSKIALPRKTNADRIREMSDRELAAAIMCPYDSEPGHCIDDDCLECCLRWLQQPEEVK